jgi:hydrogenase-4 component D
MSDPGLIGFVLLLGVPLLGALLAGTVRGKAGDRIAVVAALATALTAGALVLRHGTSGVSLPIGGLPLLDRVAGHPVPLFGFALDPLSSVVLLGAVILGFVCVLYSVAYVGPKNRETPASDDRREYWFWILLFVMAMCGLVTAATLVQMLVFWEITTLCSWALIGFYHHEEGAIGAAQKAFLMTAGGGLALFATVLTLLALTHSAGFGAMAELPPAARGATLLLWVLLLAGAWAKSGQAPFHTWLPSAMVAPSPVSAYLHAASMVNAGVYLALRMTLANAAPAPAAARALAAIPAALPVVVGVMAVVTMVVAVAQFFYQGDLKRLLAWSTISQLALVMLGVSLAMAGSTRAAQGAALHILAHGVGKALLFLSVGALSYAAGTRRIADLSGVRERAPIAAAGFLIGALTVTGVPPFAGFWSKLLIVMGASSLGGIGPWVAALVIAESLVAFAWFLWVGQRVFLGKPSPAAAGMTAMPASLEAALVILIVLSLAITLVGLPLATAVRPGGFGG